MAKLTQEQIDHLMRTMGERLRREMEEIDAVTARTRDERREGVSVGNSGSRLERTSADIALEADAAVVSQDAQDVRDIVAARRRVAAGTYGVCVDCGNPIGYERLLAYPTAKRCIDCQREYEMEKSVREGRGGP